MDFLPDTQAALDEYMSLADPDLTATLHKMGTSATRIVPECVGLSLTLSEEDLTFTMVAERVRRIETDARSPVQGDPGGDALDEDQWLRSAQARAAAGIASTLSFPILDDGWVVGSIILYASTAHAFFGHHQELADAVGGSAVGAVTNSDLAFASRDLAAVAPGQLRDQRIVDVAVGILAASEHLDIVAARLELSSIARASGVTDVEAAQVVIHAHNR